MGYLCKYFKVKGVYIQIQNIIILLPHESIKNQKAEMAQTQQLPTIFTVSSHNLPNIHTNTPSSSLKMNFSKIRAEISIEEHPFPPNAMRRKMNSSWMGGFSLGIDLGLSRTGIAISKGFSIRPLKVCCS